MIAVEAQFSVVDEGDGFIVVDKAAPLIVHPANDKQTEPTLLGGVQQLLSYEIANGAQLSIINRLDRETSGLVLMATKKSMARAFSRAMERRQVKKEYEAIVFGHPEWDSIQVDAPILRKGEKEESPIYVKQMVHEDGKACVTSFEVVRRLVVNGREVSLLRVRPHTGRMHQIRVHSAYLGFPLVGDKIYGENEGNYLRFIETGMDAEMERELMLPRHALHACGMSLEVEGQELEWSVGLAGDLRRFLAGADEIEG